MIQAKLQKVQKKGKSNTHRRFKQFGSKICFCGGELGKDVFEEGTTNWIGGGTGGVLLTFGFVLFWVKLDEINSQCGLQD